MMHARQARRDDDADVFTPLNPLWLNGIIFAPGKPPSVLRSQSSANPYFRCPVTSIFIPIENLARRRWGFLLAPNLNGYV